MAVKGYYPTGYHILPAPYVQALLLLPRLQLQLLVNFMIDTGADFTTLSLSDVERMNLDYRLLRGSSTASIQGIGGSHFFYQQQALLFLRDEADDIYNFQIVVNIPRRGTRQQANEQRQLPSVLGRDILNQCIFVSNYPGGTVEITPPIGAKLPLPMPRLI